MKKKVEEPNYNHIYKTFLSAEKERNKTKYRIAVKSGEVVLITLDENGKEI